MITIRKIIRLPLFLAPFALFIFVSCGGGGDGSNDNDPEISVNNGPKLDTIGDKILFKGEKLSFSVSASDPDGDSLTFSASDFPDDATFLNQVFEWDTAMTDAGTYQVTFKVVDDGVPSMEASETITITVSQFEYGMDGPFSLEEITFENDLWPTEDGGVPVSVLLPVERDLPVPVIFYSHPFGGTDWHYSETLFRHLVSLGIAVVFSPYPTLVEDYLSILSRYEMLWRGFEMAVDQYYSSFDLSKVGFAGHSFGGGATPAMAWKGFVEFGWGNDAAFMFMMAPWYSYDISEAQLAAFPEHVYMVEQVYDDDIVNDHRMAIDIFNAIGIPMDRKSYCNVQDGGHETPTDRQEDEDLRRNAVYAMMDALIDAAFGISRPENGKAFAIDGSGEHIRHSITKNPEPVEDDSHYKFPWSSPYNPRF